MKDIQIKYRRKFVWGTVTVFMMLDIIERKKANSIIKHLSKVVDEFESSFSGLAMRKRIKQHLKLSKYSLRVKINREEEK